MSARNASGAPLVVDAVGVGCLATAPGPRYGTGEPTIYRPGDGPLETEVRYQSPALDSPRSDTDTHEPAGL